MKKLNLQLKVPKAARQGRKHKYRYTLYCSYDFRDKSIIGFDKFEKDDNRGEFASIELARKAASFRIWYQIVDNYDNKVVEQKLVEDDDDWDD